MNPGQLSLAIGNLSYVNGKSVNLPKLVELHGSFTKGLMLVVFSPHEVYRRVVGLFVTAVGHDRFFSLWELHNYATHV